MNFDLGRGTMRVLVHGVEKSIGESFLLLKDEPVTHGSYPILITNGMLFQPAKSMINTLAACVNRIHVRPEGTNDESVMERRWQEGAMWLSDLLSHRIADEVSLAACAKALGGVRGDVFLAAVVQYYSGVKTRFTKDVMVKWNETICLKLIDGAWSIKPRAITVLSNNLHVDLAPYARGVSALLHKVFDGSYFQGVGFLYYAAGYSGEMLNSVGRTMASCECMAATSGDDWVAKIPVALSKATAGITPYREGDFSGMDQSEKEKCLRAHGVWMASVGVPSQIIDLMLLACSMPYRVKYKDLKVEGSAGYQLATGIDWTTVINSMSSLVFCMFLLKLDGVAEEVAFDLGMKIKMVHSIGVENVTFLKGSWIPDLAGDLCWFPFPSQCLKLGKVLREPRLFSKNRKSTMEGVRVVAHGIFSSMKSVPRNYPILGAFLACLQRLGTVTNSVVSASEDGWYKPSVVSVSIDRGYALSFVARRYDLSIVDIMRVEALFDAVTALPAFVYDPAMDRLRDVDYS
jgi:hypothetical protein